MEPIRVVEATLPAYEWDALVERVESSSNRAHRIAIGVGVAAALVLGAAGWFLLPESSHFSILIYAPLAGLAIWFGVRSLLTRRASAGAVTRLRSLVVPTLVDRIDTEALITLVRNGGALAAASTARIVVERRRGVVTLVAMHFDPDDIPSMQLPSGPTYP